MQVWHVFIYYHVHLIFAVSSLDLKKSKFQIIKHTLTGDVASAGCAETQLSESCAADQAAEAKRSWDTCESTELCTSQVFQTSFPLNSLNILQFPGSGQISQIKYRYNDLNFLMKQWIILAGHADTQRRLCQALCCVLPGTHMAALMLLLWPCRPCDQCVNRILFPVCFLCGGCFCVYTLHNRLNRTYWSNEEKTGGSGAGAGGE